MSELEVLTQCWKEKVLEDKLCHDDSSKILVSLQYKQSKS